METEPAGAETSRATAPKRQTSRVTSERIISPPRELLFRESSEDWSHPTYYTFTRGGDFDSTSGAGTHTPDIASDRVDEKAFVSDHFGGGDDRQRSVVVTEDGTVFFNCSISP